MTDKLIEDFNSNYSLSKKGIFGWDFIKKIISFIPVITRKKSPKKPKIQAAKIVPSTPLKDSSKSCLHKINEESAKDLDDVAIEDKKSNDSPQILSEKNLNEKKNTSTWVMQTIKTRSSRLLKPTLKCNRRAIEMKRKWSLSEDHRLLEWFRKSKTLQLGYKSEQATPLKETPGLRSDKQVSFKVGFQKPEKAGEVKDQDSSFLLVERKKRPEQVQEELARSEEKWRDLSAKTTEMHAKLIEAQSMLEKLKERKNACKRSLE